MRQQHTTHLCYAKADIDHEQLSWLKNGLSSAGIPFTDLDEDGIPGRPEIQQMESMVLNASWIVLFYTPRFMDSHDGKFQEMLALECAIEKGLKNIILIMQPGLSGFVSKSLSIFQSFNLSQDQENCIKKVTEVLTTSPTALDLNTMCGNMHHVDLRMVKGAQPCMSDPDPDIPYTSDDDDVYATLRANVFSSGILRKQRRIMNYLSKVGPPSITAHVSGASRIHEVKDNGDSVAANLSSVAVNIPETCSIILEDPQDIDTEVPDIENIVSNIRNTNDIIRCIIHIGTLHTPPCVCFISFILSFQLPILAMSILLCCLKLDVSHYHPSYTVIATCTTILSQLFTLYILESCSRLFRYLHRLECLSIMTRFQLLTFIPNSLFVIGLLNPEENYKGKSAASILLLWKCSCYVILFSSTLCSFRNWRFIGVTVLIVGAIMTCLCIIVFTIVISSGKGYVWICIMFVAFEYIHVRRIVKYLFFEFSGRREATCLSRCFGVHTIYETIPSVTWVIMILIVLYLYR